MADSHGSLARAITASMGMALLGFAVTGRHVGALLAPDAALGADGVALVDALRLVAAGIGAILSLLALSDPQARVVRSRGFVCAVPFVVLLAFAFIKYRAGVANGLYLSLAKEDSLVEDSGALAVFAGGLLTLRNAARARHRRDMILTAGLLLLGLFMVWLALEEVSYAQRFLGFGTPAPLQSANYQEEVNLHNISGLEWLMDVIGPDIIIAWGLFGWAAAGLVRRASGHAGWTDNLHLLAPPWFVASWFVPYAIWAHLDVCCGEQVITISKDQEPAEAFLEFAFLAYACWAWWRMRGGMALASTLPLYARGARS